MTEINIPKVIELEVDKIKEDPTNPNKMSKEELEAQKESIKKFGFIVPIITNKDYLIADGYHRLQAAKAIGMKKVPVIALDVDEVDRRIIRQVLNKLRGEHDWELDKAEFKYLDEAGALSELLMLMPDERIDIKTSLDELKMEDSKEEEPIQLPTQTDIKLGDMFQLGNHRLLCGDATKSEDVAKLMGGDMAVLMVTDPPYGVSYDPKWRDEADKKGVLGNKYAIKSVGEVKNDDKVDWSEAYSLFNGCVAYIWHAGRHAKDVATSIENCGFEIISQIIWVKPHFALSRGDYHWKHEPCWYAVKKGKSHNWQGIRNECSVWEISGMNPMGRSQNEADERTGHGTQKPIECMLRPIKNNSSEGEGVYDPFGGSGTTLIAAEQLNRKCYMMELDPIYVQTIINRWEKYTGKKAEKI